MIKFYRHVTMFDIFNIRLRWPSSLPSTLQSMILIFEYLSLSLLIIIINLTYNKKLLRRIHELFATNQCINILYIINI